MNTKTLETLLYNAVTMIVDLYPTSIEDAVNVLYSDVGFTTEQLVELGFDDLLECIEE